MGGSQGKFLGPYVIDSTGIIGKGGFGEVFLGHHKSTKEQVAIKKCVIKHDSHGSIAMSEIKNFQRIPPHKHIVKMKDFYFHDNAFWIVMEYCDKGDLEKFMNKYRPGFDAQLKIMHQCASAISHMHSLDTPMIHRDIKPSNILFKRENSSDIVKLTDFGISKLVDQGVTHGTVIGTEHFMPPEMIVGKPYDESVDTYALGLVYLAMINYNPAHEMMCPLSDSAIRAGKTMPLGKEMVQAALGKTPQPRVVASDPRDTPKLKAIKNLIREMTSYKPQDRKSMKAVLKVLEDVDGGKIQGVRGTSASSRGLFTSNLSAQKTVAGYVTSGPSSGSKIVEEEEEEEDIPEDAGDSSDSDEDEKSERADIGYLLLRGMAEEELRKKREKEHQEEQERRAAQAALGLLPLLALLHLAEGDEKPAKQFEIGERVVFIKDLMKAMQLQKGHGGWTPEMAKYLDEEGIVKDHVNNDCDLKVEFKDGHTLVLNAQLLTKSDPHSSKETKLPKCKFKIKDVVKMVARPAEFQRMQKDHGGFNSQMLKVIGIKGIVRHIFQNGDVNVEFFNGNKWRINTDALELVDTTGMPIESGDLVLVSDDRVKVKRLQEGHGEWIDSMTPCLGEAGIVKAVGSNGRALVEINDTCYTWNVKSLKLLVKAEEMVALVLRDVLFDA